jgi:hypothetical protein
MKKKRVLYNFEPPEDIAALLAAAEKATGSDRTTLIIEAIRTDLPKVVQRIIEERKRAAEEFFRISQQAGLTASATKAKESSKKSPRSTPGAGDSTQRTQEN